MDPTIFAAVLVVAGPFLYAMWVRLGHINGAVNNKDRDEPTLRELAVTTAGHLGELRGLLEAHTLQDAANFNDLHGEILAVRENQ